MPWIDRMSRARFRGLEFLTDSHEATGGRRLVTHEYPGADVPLVEDFGLAAWDWSLTAYFIGPDYDIPRNELLTLLAEPGPDWLTHPWLGELWVRPQKWTVSESSEQNGYTSVKISFIPGGERQQPELAFDDIAQGAAADLADAAVADYDIKPMSADAMQQYVAAVQQRLEGLRKIISLATLPLSWAGMVMNVISGIKTDLAAIAAIPKQYAAAFRSLATALGLGGRDDIAATARAATVGRIALAAGASRRAVTLTGASAADQSLLASLRAEYALEQRLIAAAAMSVAVAEYPSEFDRDQALAAVEKCAADILPIAPDTVFQPAATARAAVIRALRAQDFRPVVRRDIVRPLPAVLIAHNLGTTEEAFLTLNTVRHPLFVNGIVYG
jgi:prophage DNA circulation protein